VLLMSGAPDLTSAMKAIEYGVFEYLTKPVPFEKLCISLKKALETRRQRVKRKDALEQFQSSARELKRLPRVGADQEWTGALLGGRYRVGALLGSGGMGTVYEAVREDLAQMRVAIKVLQDGLSTDAEHLARFRREAETVAALDHPNIVRILDFQAPPGEPAFIVMERLEGASLGAVLTAEGPFGPGRTAFIATQVLVALAAAHRANVIHRDLKPDNVFLTAMSGVSDLVKLLDFGIAKLLGGPDVQKLTQTGAVMGTPAYMAPEHARGAYVDRRSDIYAVGCVMYEALTGRAPFQAENYNALLFAIQASDPTSLAELRPDLDSDLVAIVECAMAKVPEARFQSAEAMAEALAPWASPNPSTRRAAPNSSAMAFAATMLPASEDPELQKK
jgi:serine/threonine protein kinase